MPFANSLTGACPNCCAIPACKTESNTLSAIEQQQPPLAEMVIIMVCRPGGAWHAEWQAGPHSFICLCKLAWPGLVSHVIVPMRANRCGIRPQSRLAQPSVHYFNLFYGLQSQSSLGRRGASRIATQRSGAYAGLPAMQGGSAFSRPRADAMFRPEGMPEVTPQEEPHEPTVLNNGPVLSTPSRPLHDSSRYQQQANVYQPSPGPMYNDRQPELRQMQVCRFSIRLCDSAPFE